MNEAHAQQPIISFYAHRIVLPVCLFRIAIECVCSEAESKQPRRLMPRFCSTDDKTYL